MRDRHTREVLFVDLILSVSPPGIAGVQSLRWFATHIKNMVDAKLTARWGRNKIRKIHIVDMSDVTEEVDSVTLLLHLNDINGPDASFCHIETDEPREEAKGVSEGRPETVHLMLKLAPTQQGGNRYLGLLEVSSKLNRGQIERYINWILKEIKKRDKEAFTYDHPDGSQVRGKPRKVTVTPQAELQGHASDEFIQEIQAGKLSGIRLISKEAKHLSTGETALIKPEHAEIKIVPVRKWSDDKMGCIRHALRLGKAADYSTAKISFVSPDGVSHTCELDTETENVRGDGYIKKRRIHRSDIVLPEAEPGLNDFLVVEMQECFNT